jgi:hypothetical protein
MHLLIFFFPAGCANLCFGIQRHVRDVANPPATTINCPFWMNSLFEVTDQSVSFVAVVVLVWNPVSDLAVISILAVPVGTTIHPGGLACRTDAFRVHASASRHRLRGSSCGRTSRKHYISLPRSTVCGRKAEQPSDQLRLNRDVDDHSVFI